MDVEHTHSDDGVTEVVAWLGPQRWRVTWQTGQAPRGRNHGISAVATAEDRIVLVSRDRTTWEFPAGRPEGPETLFETLERELAEEACCHVLHAGLLGFTRSECLEGVERGIVLVRAHWAVRARVLSWEPQHEIVDRRLLSVPEARSTLTVEPSLQPVMERIWSAALTFFGSPEQAPGGLPLNR